MEQYGNKGKGKDFICKGKGKGKASMATSVLMLMLMLASTGGGSGSGSGRSRKVWVPSSWTTKGMACRVAFNVSFADWRAAFRVGAILGYGKEGKGKGKGRGKGKEGKERERKKDFSSVDWKENGWGILVYR